MASDRRLLTAQAVMLLAAIGVTPLGGLGALAKEKPRPVPKPTYAPGDERTRPVQRSRKLSRAERKAKRSRP